MIEDGEGLRYYEGVSTFSVCLPITKSLGRMAWNGSSGTGEWSFQELWN
jgi:hypothetical protein